MLSIWIALQIRFTSDLLLRCQACQLITAIIVFMRRVSLGPFPMGFVRAYQLIERYPQIFIYNRLLGRRAPAVPLPAGHPACNSISQIFGIGNNFDLATLL